MVKKWPTVQATKPERDPSAPERCQMWVVRQGIYPGAPLAEVCVCPFCYKPGTRDLEVYETRLRKKEAAAMDAAFAEWQKISRRRSIATHADKKLVTTAIAKSDGKKPAKKVAKPPSKPKAQPRWR